MSFFIHLCFLPTDLSKYIHSIYLQGHTGGGFRRNSVSDGADSLSRSASDSSVSNPGGSSHNNKNGNGGAMGNGSSNGLG